MSHLFGRSPNGYHKARRSPLPSHHKSSSSSSSAYAEKLHNLDTSYSSSSHFSSLDSPTPSSWTTVFVPLPFSRPSRKVRLSLPIPARLSRRIGGRRALLLLVGLLVTVFWLMGLLKGKGKRLSGGDGENDGGGGWVNPFKDPGTLVFTKEEVRSVWEWEVMSGHWPSTRKVPQSNLPPGYVNPSIPADLLPPPLSRTPSPTSPDSPAPIPFHFAGSGPIRTYANLSIPANPQEDMSWAWPRRPTPGAAADLDVLLEQCDFGKGMLVRDCLEVLRIGGGLDNNKRLRRADLSPWSYVYTESPDAVQISSQLAEREADQRAQLVLHLNSPDGTSPALDIPVKVENDDGSPSSSSSSTASKLVLPAPYPPRPPPSTLSSDGCDPNRPRLFHIFWAGPFTDKPYMAILSFLYTQNLGLDLTQSQWSTSQPSACRPQFLVWINPGRSGSIPNPSAKREMYEALATNPWSAPFLHARFKDVVKFKMWNTTEQLDGVPELKPYWRSMPILNSAGDVLKVKKDEENEGGEGGGDDGESSSDEDESLLVEKVVADLVKEGTEAKVSAPKHRKAKKLDVGLSAADQKLATVLSDMVRFVLLHRYGGIYLDADNLLLRDWEELWNWRGAFAYRWSWHEKYNTAIIKMHKGSALTSFLFKTALENSLDFHPMTISRYLADAGLDPLLFRLPDALFDSAWLNMEGYQRDRPPFPYFSEFKKFFVGDKNAMAEASVAGFDSFFRGAFGYHWHNNWLLPFDPSRNFPDLGNRFHRGEKLIRDSLRSSSNSPIPPSDPSAPTDASPPPNPDSENKKPVEFEPRRAARSPWMDRLEEDEREVAWAAVLKRTFEGYIRGERPNMYGEWLMWE